MNRILSYLIYFLLFGLPFIILPFGISQFEIPKVIVAQVAIEAIAFAFLILKRKLILSTSEKICYVFLSGIALLDYFLFPSQIALFGNQFRQQGLFLFFHLLIFSLFVRQFSLLKTPRALPLLFLIGQLGGIFIFSSNDVGRAYGFLGEPNALASTAVFALPLLFLAQARRQYLFPGLLLCGIILFASGSRSGVVAAMVELGFILLSQNYPKKMRYFFTGAILISLLFFVFTFFLSDPHESRVEIWHAATVAFSQRPLIGGGVGNVETMIHSSSQTFASFISARYVDSSHNIFFDILLQTGIIGFAAFLYLLIAAFRFFLQTKQIVFVAALLGMTIVLSFNPGSVWELVVFWYLIGNKVNQPENHATISS